MKSLFVIWGIGIAVMPGVAAAQDSPELDSVETPQGVASAQAPLEPESKTSVIPPEPEERPRLSDHGELERIIELYMAGSYETCSSQLDGFLDPKGEDQFSEPDVIEQGRLYFATCALLQGRRADARAALRAALEQNPLMQSPDSLTFPPPVVSLFLEVRDEVTQLIADSEKEQVVRLRRENELARRRAELRDLRERELEKLAREESLVGKNSRYFAAVPFGVGQYQNGQSALGALFLVTEGLLLGTAVTSGLILEDLSAKAAKGDYELTRVKRFNSQRTAAYKALTYSAWGFVGVAALGVAEAQFNFKAERKLASRQRALPKELEVPPEPEASQDSSSGTLSPLLGLSPQGGFVGLLGTF